MKEHSNAGWRWLVILLIAALPASYLGGVASVIGTDGLTLVAHEIFREKRPGWDPTTSGFWKGWVDRFESSKATAEVVMLGDSQTQGYEWSEAFPGKIVLNRGITGDSSFGVLKRLDEVIGRKPSKVFVMIGVNDLMYGLTPEESASNQATLISRLLAASIQPYVQSILFTRRPGEVNEKIAATNKILRSHCENTPGCTYVDLNPELSEDGVLRPEFTSDGLHLTLPGYLAWQRAIEPIVYR